MKRAVLVRFNEACGVLAVYVHVAFDERGVLKGKDALAAHVLEYEAQAVFLYGIE